MKVEESSIGINDVQNILYGMYKKSDSLNKNKIDDQGANEVMIE